MDKNQEKGITIMALTITVVVMLILLSIASYTGIDAIQKAKRTSFITELKTIQAKVYYYAEKDSKEYMNLGKPISNLQESKKQEITNNTNITLTDSFRYFTAQDLEQMEISGIKQGVLINFEQRQVISVEGIELEGKKYYTLEELGEEEYVPSQAQNTVF